MSTTPTNGGPAFPVNTTNEQNAGAYHPHPGMSLRDYFAAKAMQGLIASNDGGAGDRIEEIPIYAYQIADAMISARNQTTK